jgi:RNA polymerase sigma factor (sigma-70 family)
VDAQGIGAMTSTEQDRLISEVMAAESPRLRNFIRRRVPGGEDADDILQEVFYELVRAHRLLMPIDTVSSWLYSVARNRITDLFRKKTPDLFTDLAVEGDAGELLDIADLLPSPDAGPEAAYLRKQLLLALESAITDLPPEQRAVFVANELEGRSFKELAAESGISINTLLSRKRYAVFALRRRLETIHKEFIRK